MCSKSIPYLPALCTSWLALRWPGRVVGDHSANAVCSILGVLWWILQFLDDWEGYDSFIQQVLQGLEVLSFGSWDS